MNTATGILPENFDEGLRNEVTHLCFNDGDISKKGNIVLHIKTVVFISLFISSYYIAVLSHFHWLIKLFASFILGLCICGLGMGVGHEASHKAYSEKKWVNDLLVHTFTLIGVSAFIWWMKHVVLHHSAPNYDGKDDDTDLWPMFRIYLKDKILSFHKHQHIYCYILYPTLVFVWIFFLDTQKWWRRKVGVTPFIGWKGLRADILFVLTKLWHIFLFIYLPIHTNGWLIGISIYAIAMAVSGHTLSWVFQCAHLSKGIPIIEKGKPKPTGARLQLVETTNFAPGNVVLTWFVGGLNYQVEHHLFPNISSVHYPRIAPVVRGYIEKYNKQNLEPPIPYRVIPTFKLARKLHRECLKERAEAV